MTNTNPTRVALGVALAVSLAAGGCTQVQGVRPGPTVTTSTGPVPPREAPEPERPREAVEIAPVSTSREVRGLWVVRTTLTSEDGIRRMVRETHEAGFNTLLVQVRGRADAFYASSVESRAVQLRGAPSGFDPLALVVQEAHARGMEVHAWVVAQLVWGIGPLPDDPGHLVNLRPDWLAVPRALSQELYDTDPFHPSYRERIHRWAVAQDGRVEGMFASPSHAGARERLVRVVEDLLRRYRLDGVHLDYLRYPSPEFDYSRRSLQDFRAWAISRIPTDRAAALDIRVRDGDVTAWPRENGGLWAAWRQAQVTTTLRAVRAAVDQAPGGPLLTAAVFADPVDALRGRFQDWGRWLEEGLVDAVAPMAYTPDDGRFADLMEAARRADGPGGGRRVWAGVGIYQTDLDGAVRKVDLARAAGAGGVVLFSYDWATAEGSAAAGEPYLGALARRAFRDDLREP